MLDLAWPALAVVRLTLDDLTIIANAIEREFDCDIVPDEEMQACHTVRELVALIARRLRSGSANE